jgi:hypothetical protein
MLLLCNGRGEKGVRCYSVGSTTKRVRERERRGGDRESEELSAVG